MIKKLSLGRTVYDAVLMFDTNGIVIGNSEIRALKKFFGDIPEAFSDPYAVLEVFNANLERDGLPITEALHTQGKEWFTKSKRVILKQVEHEPDRALVEMATEGEIEKFLFEGMCNISSSWQRNNMARNMSVIPIWRVVLKNGNRFSYAYGSWQGGAGIFINPPTFP